MSISIFTKIVKGEIPSYKVAETDNCLAFLDVFPIAKGHTLVIPKKEIDLIYDVPENLYQELFGLARNIAKAIEYVIPCKRVAYSVVGLEVPHAHIHLIPINEIGDVNFSKDKLQFTKEEFTNIASLINEQYSSNERR